MLPLQKIVKGHVESLLFHWTACEATIIIRKLIHVLLYCELCFRDHQFSKITHAKDTIVDLRPL